MDLIIYCYCTTKTARKITRRLRDKLVKFKKNVCATLSLIINRVYRLVQKKGTVLLSTSLAWPAVAGCSRAETLSQLSSISFAQPCILTIPGANLLHFWCYS